MKFKIIYTGLIFYSLLVTSCSTTRIGEQQSLGLNVKNTITADVETTPTPQGREDDSADDPAIWINKSNPAESLIFGTDKIAGIATYALSGEELQYDKVGKINNIDIRQEVLFDGIYVDVIAGTNRTDKDIIIGTIDSNGKVNYQSLSGTEELQNFEVYGFALGMVDSRLKAFVNTKSGNIFIYDLDFQDNQWTASLSKQLKLKSQPEGMVVDDAYKTLYIGEENYGIWKINLADYSFSKLQLSNEKNDQISFDLEGVSLYKTSGRDGYLLASSQGNNSFAIFEREGNNKYIKSFRIVDGAIDGVEETDGIDLTSVDLGETFPNGILVVQDGFNYDGKKKKSQNFKIIDWNKIQELIKE